MAKRLVGGAEEHVELEDEQKVSIAKWFLLNSPPGEIQQLAKDVREVLCNSALYNQVVAEAFPEYNVEQMISVETSNGTGQVLVTRFAELGGSSYLDLRTAQVATVDHVKQICKSVRPASDEELPSAFVEGYRACIDAELIEYVQEAYPRGSCSVYCTRGKDTGSENADFELTVVISNCSFSSQNYRGGRWRSIWKLEIQHDNDLVEMSGKINVDAHYFEDGNVQLKTNHECRDSTLLQDEHEIGPSIVAAIRHQESEYLDSLAEKYTNLSDTTFKELRRKLPLTRTQFSWENAVQLSLSRKAAREASMIKQLQQMASVSGAEW